MPSEFTVLSNFHVGEGEGGVLTVFDGEWVGVVGVFLRRDVKLGRGGAGKFYVEV
jgi:hypothetical protein